MTSQREHTTQIADAAPFILPPERDWAPTTWAASALVFLLVAFGAYFGVGLGIHSRLTPFMRRSGASVPATLAIEGALTGTRVSTGGRVLGVTDSGGEFRIELPAGSYTVVLSKEGYRPRTISQELSRGAQLTIGPPPITP